MITTLPFELQLQVVSHFQSFQQVGRFGCVCKELYETQRTDFFWKEVARNFKIPIPANVDIRSWIIEHYQVTKQCFAAVAHFKIDAAFLNNPFIHQHFPSQKNATSEERRKFFTIFSGVFHITPTPQLQHQMVQDLVEKAASPAILRLSRAVLFAHFCAKQIMLVPRGTTVLIEDLQKKECAYVKQGFRDLIPLNHILEQVLNVRLWSVEKKMVSRMKVRNIVFAPGQRWIKFRCPEGLQIHTQPLDLVISFASLCKETRLNPEFVVEVLPSQEITVQDIPGGLNTAIHEGLQSPFADIFPQVRSLIDTYFARYRLKLQFSHHLIIVSDYAKKTLTFCSRSKITFSKLTVQS